MKSWDVTLQGNPTIRVDAPTKAKALLDLYHSPDTPEGMKYGLFLRSVTIKRSEKKPPYYGSEIFASGYRSYFLEKIGDNIKHVRPGETKYVITHKNDTLGVPNHRGTKP
jgi:hypothetical protein